MRYACKQKPRVSHDCKVAVVYMLHQCHSGVLMTGAVQIAGENGTNTVSKG